MKNILCFTLLLIAGVSYGQIRFGGVVKDSLGTPLELANVIAINQETKGMESYGITNDQGIFKLELGKNSTFEIQISYVGMTTFKEVLTTAESNLEKTYTLVSENALDEVELVYTMPVTMKGDTLVYDADSFNTGTERKLEDVLETLIGLEIVDEMDSVQDMRAMARSKWEDRAKHFDNDPNEPVKPSGPARGS